MDLYSERQVRDTRSDQQASRTMLGESHGLAIAGLALAKMDSSHAHQVKFTKFEQSPQTAQQKSLSDRESMAFMSIAFCSPLMLFGVGATLAVVDDLHGGKQSKMENSLQNQIRWNADVVESQRVAALLLARSQTAEKFATVDAAKDRTQALVDRIAETKKVEKPNLKRPSQCNFDVAQARKNWMKTSKLLKEKQALHDHLQKFQGQLSLEDVSALNAQIEQLDKALKKLGC
jgi:hypothetical protein